MDISFYESGCSYLVSQKVTQNVWQLLKGKYHFRSFNPIFLFQCYYLKPSFHQLFSPGKKASLMSSHSAPSVVLVQLFTGLYDVNHCRLKITWPTNSFTGTTERSKKIFVA